uniref:GRIP domain-containing protein n=1 Tax=Loa loa TaxID=7209 RepID=A0A1I7VST6_LOALO
MSLTVPPSGSGGGGAVGGSRGSKLKGTDKATIHSFSDLVPALKSFLYDKNNVELNKLLSLLEAKTQLPREQVKNSQNFLNIRMVNQ